MAVPKSAGLINVDNLVSLSQLMSDRLLQIPDYQRGYAWEHKQVSEFIEDVTYLPAQMTHFTGTIVLDPSAGIRRVDTFGQEFTKADVVDGQQRLTTSIIVLDQLRRRLQGDPVHGDKAQGISRAFLAVQAEVSQEPMFKLQLNRDTQDFWANVMLADDPSPLNPRNLAEERLVAARDEIRAWLDATAAEGGPDALSALLTKLVNRLRFVLYEVDSAAEVGVIFEVMNDRGKPLTELEKVKNYVLFAASKLADAHDYLASETNKAATTIYEKLMAADLTRSSFEDQLLRSDWLMRYDPVTRNWMGVRSVKERFPARLAATDPSQLQNVLLEYVTQLRKSAGVYADIHAPMATGAFTSFSSRLVEIRRASERLRRVGALASFLPVLMAARLRSPDDDEGYLQLVEACERYAFRVYRFLQLRANAGQSRLFRLGHDVFTGQADGSTAAQEVDALTNAYCPLSQFEGRFDREEDRNWYAWGGLGYFLYEYEAHLSGGVVTALPFSRLERDGWNRSIEHILPQDSTRACWQERFTAEELAGLTHDIGNLVLTVDNSSLGTKCFVEKKGAAGTKACYASSTLRQEQELVSYADWTPDAIRDRRRRLKEWALVRWAVPGDQTVDLGADDAEELSDWATDA